MQKGSRGLQTVVWGVLGVVLMLILVLFVTSRGKRSNLPELGVVQQFSLTNQVEEVVTLGDLHGKVWIADIIFTRCAGPCPKMTGEMKTLQAAFGAREKVRFVTLTTDPGNDTPKVLQRYAKEFNADPNRWYFLTGPKEELLANLAIGSLKMTALEKQEDLQQNANDLFIHTTMFFVVDKRGKLRAVHESVEPGFQEKIQADIKSLLAEGD